MEYTIYNESLVYYALMNPRTGYYLSTHTEVLNFKGNLLTCDKFKSRDEAENRIRLFPEYSQIRKVKIIDIGEAWYRLCRKERGKKHEYINAVVFRDTNKNSKKPWIS